MADDRQNLKYYPIEFRCRFCGCETAALSTAISDAAYIRLAYVCDLCSSSTTLFYSFADLLMLALMQRITDQTPT